MLAQNPAQGVDPRGPGRDPLLAHAVQRDERLLLDAFHRHARHLARAHRFEDRFGIGAIGLIASHVRAHIRRRDQRHAMPLLLRQPSPVVRHAARFHHDVQRRGLCEVARELRPIQTLTPHDAPLRIRDRELEHALCQVHSHCRSIHLGLLLVAADGNQRMRQ